MSSQILLSSQNLHIYFMEHTQNLSMEFLTLIACIQFFYHNFHLLDQTSLNSSTLIIDILDLSCRFPSHFLNTMKLWIYDSFLINNLRILRIQRVYVNLALYPHQLARLVFSTCTFLNERKDLSLKQNVHLSTINLIGITFFHS